MPSITLPQTVYCLSRKRASSKQMKNWLLALFGLCARAIDSGAAHMRLGVELGRQVRIVRSAGAGAVRTAGLRHEAVDDAVEHDPVVEALADELLDALDMLRREVGAQLDHDVALRGLERQSVFVVSHETSACFRVRASMKLTGERPSGNRAAHRVGERHLRATLDSLGHRRVVERALLSA